MKKDTLNRFFAVKNTKTQHQTHFVWLLERWFFVRIYRSDFDISVVCFSCFCERPSLVKSIGSVIFLNHKLNHIIAKLFCHFAIRSSASFPLRQASRWNSKYKKKKISHNSFERSSRASVQLLRYDTINLCRFIFSRYFLGEITSIRYGVMKIAVK